MTRMVRQFAIWLALPLALVGQTVAPASAGQIAPAQIHTAPVQGAAPAAAAESTAATGPRTTIASDSNSRSHAAAYQSCLDRLAASKGKPVDILFVGDSITEGWTATAWGGVNRGAAVWDKLYAPRNALNFGMGADRTQHVLWRLETMDVQDLKPKVTVLLIGTNNNIDPAEDIAAGAKAVIAELETMYPATKIILVSILPNARATQLMNDANAMLRTLADDRTVFYLDVAAKMPPVDDNWVGLGPDKLHPSEAGYQIWADTMEPLLARLLAQ